MTEPWVNTETVAAHTGKSIFTVRNRFKAGDWPAIKSGRDWLAKLSAIDDTLNPPAAPEQWATPPKSRHKTT